MTKELSKDIDQNNINCYCYETMELNAYLKTLSMGERETLALACETSVGYLKLVASGHRKCREKLATTIEVASSGQVTRRDLRPLDWDAIWPELKAAQR